MKYYGGLVDALTDKYLKKIEKYIDSVSLTKIYIAEWELAGQEGSLDDMKHKLAQEVKNPDGWCIAVWLKKEYSKLPKGSKIPRTFQGVPVYVLRNQSNPPEARPARPGKGE